MIQIVGRTGGITIGIDNGIGVVAVQFGQPPHDTTWSLPAKDARDVARMLTECAWHLAGRGVPVNYAGALDPPAPPPAPAPAPTRTAADDRAAELEFFRARRDI